MSAPHANSSTSLTPEQACAITTRGPSVVLSSGAGCGKTHVLTQRYLSHLAEGAEVGQIVAITFTDRAARQMRGRIRAEVARHIREAASPEVAETWSRHLRALESAPISTIHAFCGTLLRQNPVEARLDPHFEVLEEVLAVNLRRDALDTGLERLLLAATPVGEDLRELVLLYGWRVVQSTVESLLFEFDERPWQAWLEREPEQIAQEWLQLARDEILPRLLASFVESRPAVTRCLELLRRHPPLPGPMADPVAVLLEETPRLPKAPDPAAALERLIQSAKVGRAGAKAWPVPAVYESIKKAFEGFREDLRTLQLDQFDAEEGALAEAVRVGQRWLRVTRSVVEVYRERKRHHGVVDFQDLLVGARDLLRDHPEVRAGLQERYQHLLIDELQDTDPVQMELVEYLAGGGLAGGVLFAVGDHKQSIYRFRGADVSLFQALRRQVPHEGRQKLTVNFRSRPAILNFVNALFAPALEDYEPLVPHREEAGDRTCVEFLWTPRAKQDSAAEARAGEAETIARRIADMIDRETLVHDEATGAPRPVRAGDVVLLFRAMSNVHLYESALRRHGLDYYLVGGRAFFAQQEIFDILNLLRALENPQDEVSLAGVLRSPFCCLSDEALFVLARHRQGLWAALFDEHTQTLLPADQRERTLRTGRNLERWRAEKDRLPIRRLFQTILSESGYDAAVQMEYLGERKLANLWKLADLARTFDRSGLFGLAEFIARLGDFVSRQPREEQASTQPESADVVRLMTIHQAKGLEFPVVVVPDLTSRTGAPFYPAARWHPRLGCVVRPPAEEEEAPFAELGWRLLRSLDDFEELAEDRRTFYVACTRPRDYLILSGSLPENYEPEGAWMQTLAGRFDLTSGECRAEGIPAGLQPRVRVMERGSALAEERKAEPRHAANPTAPIRVPPLELTATPRWQPAERLSGTLFGRDATLERVPRAVMDRWDFRDADGWRGLLERFAGSPAQRDLWTRALERFAGSPLRQQLAASDRVRRRVEYVWRPGSGPAIQGEIDCLWRDGAGDWHLLEWVFQAMPGARKEAYWNERAPVLGAAVRAVRESVEGRLATVGLAFVPEGKVLERPAGHPTLEVGGEGGQKGRML